MEYKKTIEWDSQRDGNYFAIYLCQKKINLDVKIDNASAVNTTRILKYNSDFSKIKHIVVWKITINTKLKA